MKLGVVWTSAAGHDACITAVWNAGRWTIYEHLHDPPPDEPAPPILKIPAGWRKSSFDASRFTHTEPAMQKLAEVLAATWPDRAVRVVA